MTEVEFLKRELRAAQKRAHDAAKWARVQRDENDAAMLSRNEMWLQRNEWRADAERFESALIEARAFLESGNGGEAWRVCDAALICWPPDPSLLCPTSPEAGPPSSPSIKQEK